MFAFYRLQVSENPTNFSWFYFFGLIAGLIMSHFHPGNKETTMEGTVLMINYHAISFM